MSDLGPRSFKYLYRNTLTTIHPDTSEELDKLETLLLNPKQLTRIESKCFKILKDLEFIEQENYLEFRATKL